MSEDLGFGVYDQRFQDPFAAADYLESIRWPNGPVCPHCGVEDEKHYRLKNQTRKLWKCRACRKQFTVTVGTIFEGSHIPLNKWLLAFYLLCSSKKGMSAHQLHRMLGITYKSAWFMAHRIRYAMEQPAFSRLLAVGPDGSCLSYVVKFPKERKNALRRPFCPYQSGGIRDCFLPIGQVPSRLTM